MGLRIRIRRRELGLNQPQLAAAVGITFQQIQKYEVGGNRVSASMLVKIAAVLDTTVAWLTGDGVKIDPLVLKLSAEPGAEALLLAWRRLSPMQKDALLLAVRAMAQSQRGVKTRA